MENNNLAVKEELLNMKFNLTPLIYDSMEEISCIDKAVLRMMFNRINPKGYGNVFPSHKTIAKDAGISVSTVKRSLIKLKEQGIIDWVPRTGGSNSYIFNNIPKELLEKYNYKPIVRRKKKAPTKYDTVEKISDGAETECHTSIELETKDVAMNAAVSCEVISEGEDNVSQDIDNHKTAQLIENKSENSKQRLFVSNEVLNDAVEFYYPKFKCWFKYFTCEVITKKERQKIKEFIELHGLVNYERLVSLILEGWKSYKVRWKLECDLPNINILLGYGRCMITSKWNHYQPSRISLGHDESIYDYDENGDVIKVKIEFDWT
jgi:DNA-binding transcriptional regulator YhcF (GntR family)